MFKGDQKCEFKMKRKVMMMSLAMAASLPNALYAKGGVGVSEQAYFFSNAAYMPHYGLRGMAEPLMDHVSVGGVSAPGVRGINNTWRLEFTPPQSVSNTDNPIADQGIRASLSLTLDF
jgi:hypothetical protein